MGSTMPSLDRAVISSNRRQLKADLRKAEKSEWLVLGEAVEKTRLASRLSLKEFAAKLRRDERQVARWIAGAEQTQVAVVFGVKEFRQLFLIALAEAVGAGVEIETVVRVRRPA